MSCAKLFEMRWFPAVFGLLAVAIGIGTQTRCACADDLSRPAVESNPAEDGVGFVSQLPEDVLSPTPVQEDVGFVPITALSVNILPKTRDEQGRALMMAPDRASEYFAANGDYLVPIEQVRLWGLMNYQWEAPAFCYNPLYFEEVNAERYGNTFGCWQPWVSAGHFYASIGLLPLKMLIEPPHDCEYYLGHYRPGRCVPFEWHCRSAGKAYECCR
ncbi:hypothetical protein CA54_59910 [Symmachiella macrocystis]|uniref:Uncharacterized protein n=1 Tax=Symmachiella macrocystis TaxID=2527985 RepID=A0A5C6AZ92_9PLAN|nr:hypothetical protein [Symmachiella macrocystis]TWU05303.1 hypothetical protein CA54_59910 [Symmachiella macrocystis]